MTARSLGQGHTHMPPHSAVPMAGQLPGFVRATLPVAGMCCHSPHLSQGPFPRCTYIRSPSLPQALPRSTWHQAVSGKGHTCPGELSLLHSCQRQSTPLLRTLHACLPSSLLSCWPSTLKGLLSFPACHTCMFLYSYRLVVSTWVNGMGQTPKGGPWTPQEERLQASLCARPCRDEGSEPPPMPAQGDQWQPLKGRRQA